MSCRAVLRKHSLEQFRSLATALGIIFLRKNTKEELFSLLYSKLSGGRRLQLPPRPTKFVVFFPASAGGYGPTGYRGQLSDAKNANDFVAYMLAHGTEPRVYFVDPYFSQPSKEDAAEISKYRHPYVQAVGEKDYEFLSYRDPDTPDTTFVYVRLNFSPMFADADPKDDPYGKYLERENRLVYTTSQSPPLDLFDVIKRGGYSVEDNMFGPAARRYTFSPEEKVLPDTFYGLQVLGTDLKRLLIRMKREERVQEVTTFVETFLPSAVGVKDVDILTIAIYKFLLTLRYENGMVQGKWWLYVNSFADAVKRGEEGPQSIIGAVMEKRVLIPRENTQ